MFGLLTVERGNAMRRFGVLLAALGLVMCLTGSASAQTFRSFYDGGFGVPTGHYSFVPEGYCVMKPPVSPSQATCRFCRTWQDKSHRYCQECGKPFVEEKTKPDYLTFGMLLRAADEIDAVHTEQLAGEPVKVITLRRRDCFDEWEGVQRDSAGNYLVIRQAEPKKGRRDRDDE